MNGNMGGDQPADLIESGKKEGPVDPRPSGPEIRDRNQEMGSRAAQNREVAKRIPRRASDCFGFDYGDLPGDILDRMIYTLTFVQEACLIEGDFSEKAHNGMHLILGEVRDTLAFLSDARLCWPEGQDKGK